jgi:hypothetical protein
MKNALKKLENQAWYLELRKVAYEQALSEYTLRVDAVYELARKNSIIIPADAYIKNITISLNLWLQQKRRELTPVANTDKEAEFFRLEDLRECLTELLSGKRNKLNELINGVERLYLPYLKETFGGNPKEGLNHLKDVWKLKIKFFNTAYSSSLYSYYLQNRESYNPQQLARVRALITMINRGSTGYSRSRGIRYNSGSPEIEKLMAEYREEQGQRKGLSCGSVSRARKFISIAGITSMEQLLSQEGQDLLIRLDYEGKVDPYEFSGCRTFFRTMFQDHNIPISAYFLKTIDGPIWVLDETLDKRIDEAWQHVRGYEKSNLPALKLLIRLFMRTKKAHSMDEFYKLKPSDFVLALFDAEKHGNSLQYFTKMKCFIQVFLRYCPKDIQWPEYSTQTYKEFKDLTESIEEFDDSQEALRFRASRFEHFFQGEKLNFAAFLIEIKDFYSEAYQRYEESIESQPRELESDAFNKIEHYILDWAYGKKCGYQKKGKIKSPDNSWRFGGLLCGELQSKEKVREFHELAGLVFQWAVGCRFKDETKNLKYIKHVPGLNDSGGDHYIFFWPEKNCFAVHFSNDRKNHISYTVPLNDVADAILKKYIQTLKIKDGEKFFGLNPVDMSAAMNKHLRRIFPLRISFEDFKNGKDFESITTHQLRHILVRHIDMNYRGDRKNRIKLVALGHAFPKLGEDGITRSGRRYAGYASASLEVFDLLRRVKNGNFLTDDQIEIQKLGKRNEVLHSKTHQAQKDVEKKIIDLHRKADGNILLSLMQLKGSLLNLSEEDQEKILGSLLSKNPQLLVKLLVKRD